ncbi:ribosome small subunit-dependent GTPase A [Croceimicrobium hydrocarbonivorans]|uniref:Small ribosomal subunit biogenesis GTPase RsgA n=1 Tax=Croceimicrobium hydrocarbonivorans TaxID=2761580 RepID=A0A7H0VAZ8_9FLAO|nr:ribosome small subunit-dependent GTPase A [Croceimicrobium hydrocarbonivorans]QNR22896.1 ribosome small subunit-dependent GTPase A [Croceimicrobium hydrocarbonivorans]
MIEEGLVIKSTGLWYKVQTAKALLDCRIRGKIRLQGIKSTNPVAVGDRVLVEVSETEEGHGAITKLLDRKNYIIRKSVNLSKQTQILAANVDQALLIATLDQPKTHLRFIDRFAVSAEAYDIPFVLVFNKTDLYTDEHFEELEFLRIVYEQAGYTVMECSAQSGEGLEELNSLLQSKISLLSGHSGVGKSSLINRIDPNLNLKTRAISEAHEQGQHTTTFAEMHPLAKGGYIIDTPGIRGFGLVNMEPAEMGDYFPEIFRLKGDCKFHNCLHQHEPGCAVKAAVEEHKLAFTRYESYLNFIEGQEDDEPYRKDIYSE